jgi:uncharacterized protein (TIGR03435 family)
MGGRVFGHRFRGFFLVLVLMMGAAAGRGVAAQGLARAPANKGGVPAKKEIKFEVISMRPAKPGFSPYDGGATHMSDTNPTPDGFITTMTVWQMLMLAYAPDDGSVQNVPMVNPPKWLSTWYVIDARVSDVDRDAWRGQDRRHVLLHAAMRDLLKERCKLVAHEQPTAFPDYELVIGKHGLKMKATTPGTAPPKEAFPLPTGGFRFATGPRDRPVWHYYGATVGELIEFLRPPGTFSPAPPIYDKTGLTGRYDFSLSMIEEPSHDFDGQTFNFPVGPLGLELKRGTYPGYKLVIEHMEKPAAN